MVRAFTNAQIDARTHQLAPDSIPRTVEAITNIKSIKRLLSHSFRWARAEAAAAAAARERGLSTSVEGGVWAARVRDAQVRVCVTFVGLGVGGWSGVEWGVVVLLVWCVCMLRHANGYIHRQPTPP